MKQIKNNNNRDQRDKGYSVLHANSRFNFVPLTAAAEYILVFIFY